MLVADSSVHPESDAMRMFKSRNPPDLSQMKDRSEPANGPNDPTEYSGVSGQS
jgi:hypothetical protein